MPGWRQITMISYHLTNTIPKNSSNNNFKIRKSTQLRRMQTLRYEYTLSQASMCFQWKVTQWKKKETQWNKVWSTKIIKKQLQEARLLWASLKWFWLQPKGKKMWSHGLWVKNTSRNGIQALFQKAPFFNF